MSTTPNHDALHILFIGSDAHTAELQWNLTDAFGEWVKADVHDDAASAREALQRLSAEDQTVTAVVAVVSKSDTAGADAQSVTDRLAVLASVADTFPLARRLVQLGPDAELPPLAELRSGVPHQTYRAPLTAPAFLEGVLKPLLDTSETLREETLRSATIRANDDVKLLRIPKTTFQELLVRDPEIAIGIVRELSVRLRKLQNAPRAENQ